MIYTISNGKYTLSISDEGAELVSLITENGFEAIWQSGGNFWTGHAPLLFPVCGRIKDGKYTVGGKEYRLANHGFIGKCKFELKEKTENKLTFVKKSDTQTLSEYPFDFTFTAEYSLNEDGVKAEFKIKNDSGKEMPYMFGWHPGFAYPDGASVLEDFTLDFGKCRELIHNPLMNSAFVNPVGRKLEIPGGKYKIDTKFLYDTDTIILSRTDNFVKLSLDKAKYAVTLKWSENLPYLCIWKYPDDKARYLCLEPWSSTPGNGDDDENFDTRRMRRLQPGAEEIFTYGVEIDN